MTVTDSASRQMLLTRPTRLVVAGVFVLFLSVFAATTQDGPAWQDSGIFQLRILRGQLHSWLGVALAHPLLIALGKLASWVPLGSVTARMNMVSALFGAITCASIAAMVLRLQPGRWFVAIAAAGWFGLGHAAWWLSTICESQIVLACLFTLELHVVLTLLRSPHGRWAALLGLINGLGLATHNLALLALPAYGLMVVVLAYRGELRRRDVAAFVGAWCLGAAPWLVLVGMEIPSLGLLGAIRSGLFGGGWQRSVVVGSGRALTMGPVYVLLQFPNLALPAAIGGLVAARRLLPGRMAMVWGYLLAIYLLFALRYDVPDQFMFFLPAYVMLSLWAAMGLARFTSGGKRRWVTGAALASMLWTPLVYLTAPRAWEAAGRRPPGRTDLAYRDPVRYWLCPWKGNEHSAEAFARATLTGLPDGSILLADMTACPPLKITQITEGLGEGVRVLWTFEAERDDRLVQPGDGPLYVVHPARGYCPDWILETATFVPAEHAPVHRAIWAAPKAEASYP